MKKTIMIRMLIAVVVLVCLGGCAGQTTPKLHGITMQGSALEQAEEKLLNECFELMEVNEQLYSGIFRSLDYTDDYVDTSSWDSLLKARASASAALVSIRQLELPVFDLASAEMDLLTEADIEANDVQREFEALEGVRISKENTAALLCYTLEDDVFMKSSVEDAIPAMAAFYRDYFILEYRYICLFANYMLIQLDEEDTWQTWIERLPYMAACADEWYEKTADVERATDRVLDEMQVLQTQMGSFLGVSKFSLEIVQEAVETGDRNALQREINTIGGVPGYFPIPTWLPDVVNLYLVSDPDTQEKRLVKAGEELNSIPSACYISCGSVMQEDVTAYGEYLQQWGIETYGTWNETKDTWQLLANSGSSTMMIEWTEDETLLYLTEPVGCLIPELYLYAMTRCWGQKGVF